MSLTDDLALVTACRDAPHLDRRLTPLVDCALAALSLIEDTLNRHAPIEPRVVSAQITPWCIRACSGDPTDHPCADYSDALAALHTIATALGVTVDA